MIRLFTAELRRLLARRITLWTTVAAFLMLLVIAGTAWYGSQPLNAAQTAANQAAYQEALDQWKIDGPQQVKDCEAEKGPASGAQPPVDCSILAPRPEWFRATPHNISEFTNSTPMGVTLGVGLVSLLIAASFVGAEFTSGSISTWLLVEPRRTRVFASKVAAVGLMSTVAMVVALPLTLVCWWVVGMLNDFSFALEPGLMTALLQQSGRAILLVPAAAMAAAGLAFALRPAAPTFVTIGLWLMAGLWFMTNSHLGWMSLAGNLEAWVVGQSTYSFNQCAPHGCTYVQRTIDLDQGGLYCFGLCLASILVGWTSFLRRDVN